MARITVGSASTNSSGVATYTYTGDGSGKKDIIAVSTIDDETVSSKPVAFEDNYWYDSSSADWYAYDSTKISYSDGVRSLTFSARSNYFYINKDTQQFFIPCQDDFAVEFDLVNERALSIYFNINGVNVNMGIGLNNATYSGKHIKLLVKPSQNITEVYADGTLANTVTNSRDFGSETVCGMRFANNTDYAHTVTISNLKVYGKFTN